MTFFKVQSQKTLKINPSPPCPIIRWFNYDIRPIYHYPIHILLIFTAYTKSDASYNQYGLFLLNWNLTLKQILSCYLLDTDFKTHHPVKITNLLIADSDLNKKKTPHFSFSCCSLQHLASSRN